tara:strand:- start:964 stop:1074 length:111 start_codon:yes stop_codon:yes gene_type:complete
MGYGGSKKPAKGLVVLTKPKSYGGTKNNTVIRSQPK